jgi:hypothetical protein
MPEIVLLAFIPGGEHNAVLVVTVGGGFILRSDHNEGTEIKIKGKCKHHALPSFYASPPPRTQYGGLKKFLDELRRKPHGNHQADDGLTISPIWCGPYKSSLFLKR